MGIVTRILSTIVILALLLGSGVVTPVAAVGEVTVSINAPANVNAGDNFTATVDIGQVQSFDATNYDVSFDPTVLEITDPVPSLNATQMYGSINGTTIPVDIVSLVDAGSGPAAPRVIRLVQNVSGLSGVSGAGYLAILHFRVIGSLSQSSNISLSNGTLSNNLAQEIPAIWVGDSVNVIAGAAPPAVITDNATIINTSSAILTGRLNSLGSYTSANVSFEWGLTTGYGNQTASQVMTSIGAFNANISGLSSNTTYHFRAKATRTGDVSVYGNDLSFTTPLINVLRDLPAAVSANATFNVTITFTAPGNQFNAIGLSDFAPTGWNATVNVALCTPTPIDSLATGNRADYIWAGPYNSGQAFTAVYRVTVPANAPPGIYNFGNGRLEYFLGTTGPFTVAVSGENQIEVVQGARIAGMTYEVNGAVLGGATITLDGATSVVSDSQGNYQIVASTTGQHTVVASKTGFRSYTRTVNITDLGAIYTLDFKANDGLVPNAPNVSYVLGCINKWKFPPAGFGLGVSKVLAVINAWKFPI